MKILLLNTHNPNLEAGAVSMDLFNLLRKRGHEVVLLVNSYASDYGEGIISAETKFSYEKKIIKAMIVWRFNKLRETFKFIKITKTDSDYCFFEIDEKKSYIRTSVLLKRAEIKPDVIIVLFTKGFINARNLFELNKTSKAPIFWIMYDMAPFTGGCHYAWDCTGYMDACGCCPGMFSNNPNDVTRRNLSFKKRFLNKTNIQIIAASEWQYKQVKSSSLFRDRIIHKIHISIDNSVFKPIEKNVVRSQIGINVDKRVIFFGAVVLSQKRKGMSYLLKSLNILREKIENSDTALKNNVLLLIAGRGIDDIAEMLPFEYHYLGKTNNSNEIASAYQASDVFVCPSIEDSGPMMINQSLMCGTPVVAFKMGVAIDLVIQGSTGYTAVLRDSKDLAQGLYNVLSLGEDDYKKMSKNCRELALRMFAPEVQITKIEGIINDAIHQNERDL